MKRAALFFLALAAACGGGDFDPPSRVIDLRLLAVRADTPYAPPGAQVHLDALAADPRGRALSFGWAMCVDPPTDLVSDCLAAQGAFTSSPSGSFDVTVPSDATSRAYVIVSVCPAPFTPTCADPELVVGVKRIFVRATDRNANPVIARVTWDGADWPENETRDARGCDSGGSRYDACDAALTHHVAAEIDPASVESGVDQNGHAFTEALIVEYYATEGIFEHDVRIAADPTSGWVARSAASGKTITMWLVVHDDRGGVAWATRQVRVE
jgi:hypothetical protein